jgi:hypothetical protein
MVVSGQRHALAVLYPWERTEARGKILCLCQGSNLDHPLGAEQVQGTDTGSWHWMEVSHQLHTATSPVGKEPPITLDGSLGVPTASLDIVRKIKVSSHAGNQTLEAQPITSHRHNVIHY